MPSQRKIFLVLGVSVILFGGLWTEPMAAQTAYGRLLGQVTDAEGAPLQGVRVSATNPSTGLTRGALSGADGRYMILSLPPGTYQVEAQSLGYHTAVREGIEIQVDQVIGLDFVLAESAIELEGLLVVAERPAIEMRNTSVATPVLPEELTALPTFNRNILSLGILAPGGRAYDGAAADFAVGFTRPGTASPTGAVYGDFILNGISTKNRTAGSSITGNEQDVFFPQEAVAEMRFITNGYDAQYRGGDKVVIIEGKRGTNELQGTAFLNTFTADLRARGAFEEGPIEDYRRFQFGTSVTGPILEDKLFYALAFERESAREPVNYIPGADVWSAYRGTEFYPNVNNVGYGRLTYQAAQEHTFDLFVLQRWDDKPVHLGGAVTPDWGWTQDQKADVLALKHQFTPRGNVSNELILNYNHVRWHTEALTDEPAHVYPSMTLGPLNFIWPLRAPQVKYQITNNLQWLKQDWFGDHLFKVGGHFAIDRVSEHWPLLKNPAFIYAVDDPNADPLLAIIGLGRTDQTGTSDAHASTSAKDIALYVQDEWTPTPRLTISLGLRWSAILGHLNNDFLMPAEFANELRAAGIPDSYIASGQRNNDLSNLAPRLRFSWDVDGSSRTVLYGGYARSYEMPPSNDVTREQRDANWLTYTIFFPGTTDAEALRDRIRAGDAMAVPNLTLLNDRIRNPSFDDFSIGVNRALTDDIAASVNLVAKYFRNGFGSYNANPIRDGSRLLTPRFGNILLSNAFWSSEYKALLLTARRAYRDGWMFQASYALGGAKTEIMRSDSPEPYTGVRAQTDERHRLTVSGLVALFNGFELSWLGTLASPTPFNAIDGRDLSGDGDLGSDYLDDRPFGFRPDQGDFGNWYRNLDLRIARNFSVGGTQLQVHADMFNALNMRNYSAYFLRRHDGEGQLLPNFGEPVAAYAPRRVQIGVGTTF